MGRGGPTLVNVAPDSLPSPLQVRGRQAGVSLRQGIRAPEQEDELRQNAKDPRVEQSLFHR